MYIHEAAELTKTTRKAIEYYCRKGLLNPALSENGYRIFSDQDVEILKKISLLRSLGVSVENISELLKKDDSAALQRIIEAQTRDLQRRKEQNDLLKELASSMDWDAVQLKAEAAQSRQAVTERLTKAFPGFWGKYLTLHFGQFLQDPVQTKDQENALGEICEYLDGADFEIPEEMESVFEEMDSETGHMVQAQSDEALSEAVNDPESWLKNNRETIEQYLELQKTDEYRNSAGFRLMELLRNFNQNSGYDTIFIPAMRRLSPAYDEYMMKLEKANQLFLQQFSRKTD